MNPDPVKYDTDLDPEPGKKNKSSRKFLKSKKNIVSPVLSVYITKISLFYI